MLDPRSRGALLEALRPPAGYVVESALATTYTLDLVALLTAPLAFSLYDRLAAQEGNKGPERLDSFALLHAVRQHAERLVVFCQSGCIAKPKGYRQLLAYLESTVVQVMAPSAVGAFHPKVWVQRFVSTVADVEEPVRYRVLCLSRNLTFDRSWDTMLAIDGVLVDRKLAIGDSKPFAEFIESLPAMAVDGAGALTAVQRQIVATMTDELRRVSFEVPVGFESMRFWPLGHDGKRRDPFSDTRIERLLVVSPFVSSGRLETLTKKGKGHILVSSLHELEAIPKEVLQLYSELHVLNDAAEDPADEGADGDPDKAAASVGPVPPARGLHAKLYVADDGRNAHVWTGSSNASDGGFELNVELLVQLTGKKKDTGVDTILDGEGKSGGLRMLLHPFNPRDQPVEPTDVERQTDELARVATRALAKAQWVARVNRADTDGKETYRMDLALRDGALELPSAVAVRAWPISLSEERALGLEGSRPTATFERCSMQAISAFFAFEITIRVGAVPSVCLFVLRIPLDGAPADRAARILHTLLDDPAKVLRFLRLLLSADAFEALGLLDPVTDADGADAEGGGPRADDTVPLFESLVRTLDREPERLMEVDRLVRELRSTPEGARLFPPSFDAVWTPVWTAYETIQTETARKSDKRAR